MPSAALAAICRLAAGARRGRLDVPGLRRDGLAIVDRSARPYTAWFALDCAACGLDDTRRLCRWAAPAIPGADRMKIDGRPYRTIWLADDGWSVEIIDQTRLPHRVRDRAAAQRCEQAAHAIKSMQVRGAPLIGATAAYGLCARACASDAERRRPRRAPIELLAAQRPTAINLRWALEEMRGALAPLAPRRARRGGLRRGGARSATRTSRPAGAIGEHGLRLIRDIAARKKPGRAGQHPDPLQRRLARLRRLGHRDRRRSTRRTTRASRCMSGSTRRGRATRAPR